jgi:RNA polymerase sigma-70 factor (ECF subfamily)
MAPADARLIQQTLSGNLDGFGELHRRYYERAVRVVTGIVRDRGQAEDMVQDAYMSALEALPRLTDRDRFYPWLCRIAVNRAIEEKRRVTRKARLHTEWTRTDIGGNSGAGGSGGQGVLEGMVSEERAESVRSALEALPEGQRASVVLRYFDGLSMKKVAEIMDCEEVTARTQVFRGLQKLGRMLKEMAPDNESE